MDIYKAMWLGPEPTSEAPSPTSAVHCEEPTPSAAYTSFSDMELQKNTQSPGSRPSTSVKALALKAVNCLRKKPAEPVYADQPESCHLLRLPLELRQEIWDLVLSPEPRVQSYPPHFHVYDDIWDSCTYEIKGPGKKAQRQNRKAQQQLDPKQRHKDLERIALLMTCRGVYDEAIQYLYNKEHFNLVLIPGRARPGENLHGHSCLGSIKECTAMLRRMRTVTIVVQPGLRPKVAAFCARIRALLEAIDNGKQTTDLRVLFNFREQPRLYPKWCTPAQSVHTILHAFHPLSTTFKNPSNQSTSHVARRKQRLIVSGQPTGTFGVLSDGEIRELAAHIGGKQHNVTTNRSKCLGRGRLGQPVDHTPQHTVYTNRRERVVTYAACVGAGAALLVTSPIVVPVYLGCQVKRKIDKGESW